MAARLQELAEEAEKKAEETRDLERQAAADPQSAAAPSSGAPREPSRDRWTTRTARS